MEENAQQITLVRTFAAPVEAVWNAWTTPEGWVEWYGKPWDVPKDSAEMDIRVGGKWKSTTIAQGNTINFIGEYREVDAPRKIVMTIELADMPSGMLPEIVTATFKKIEEGKTEMTFTQAGNLPPAEYANGLKDGWTGFFDALEAYVTQK